MKVIINTNLNEEQLQRMTELFGAHPEVLEGRELEIENEDIVNDLEKRKIAIVERVKDNDELQQRPEEKNVVEDEEKSLDKDEKEKKSEEKVDEDKSDEKSEREEKPLTEKQAKEVAEKKEIIANAINNMKFPNGMEHSAETSRIKVELIKEYCGNSNRLYSHFDENNFLENTPVASMLAGIGINAEQLHRGLQKSFYQNQDLPRDEVESTEVKVTIPPEIDEEKLKGADKERIKSEMALIVKRRIEAIKNDPKMPEAMIELKNIHGWIDRNRDVLADAIGNDDAIRNFVQEICVDEIHDVVKEANNDAPIAISLEKIDMTDPKERETAMAIMREVKNNDIPIEHVEISVTINSSQDIENAKEVEQDLVAMGINVETDAVVENEELEQEAQEELNTNPEAEVVENGMKVAMGIAAGANAFEAMKHELEEPEEEIDINTPPIV